LFSWSTQWITNLRQKRRLGRRLGYELERRFRSALTNLHGDARAERIVQYNAFMFLIRIADRYQDRTLLAIIARAYNGFANDETDATRAETLTILATGMGRAAELMAHQEAR